ncbi:MAG: nucleotidyltransferase domain-containing protein, partial [Gammaproteobacteria bacterium]|nr:nucleotidyltransferase domain-containing protein [Gammaproteobacteria bacterium]
MTTSSALAESPRFIDLDGFCEELISANYSSAAFISARKNSEDILRHHFVEKSITDLVQCRTSMIDCMLKLAWNHHCSGFPDIALIAVGGYGRCELLPGSDIDLMILLDQESATANAAISTFLN